MNPARWDVLAQELLARVAIAQQSMMSIMAEGIAIERAATAHAEYQEHIAAALQQGVSLPRVLGRTPFVLWDDVLSAMRAYSAVGCAASTYAWVAQCDGQLIYASNDYRAVNDVCAFVSGHHAWQGKRFYIYDELAQVPLLRATFDNGQRQEHAIPAWILDRLDADAMPAAIPGDDAMSRDAKAFRLTADCVAILSAVANTEGVSQTAVVEQSVREYARRKGYDVRKITIDARRDTEGKN